MVTKALEVSQNRSRAWLISVALHELRQERDLLAAVIRVLEPLAEPDSIERRARLAIGGTKLRKTRLIQQFGNDLRTAR
jgi:hypothetical protein